MLEAQNQIEIDANISPVSTSPMFMQATNSSVSFISNPPTYFEATEGREILWRCKFMMQYDQIHGLRPRNYFHLTKEQTLRCQGRDFCSGILKWKEFE
ncbi:hypothetical protein RclHR1_11300012 [Rhizophagus clarus]|nr:hypothetical protein RclHR1_11300012 [Rhizophagus clarus]GES82267.1 hypothetical protein RCL_jg10756.t2 [Rhizophagus clarus]